MTHRSALVTGGAGFIGSHLVDRLVRDGWKVRVLDSLATGSLDNLEALSGRVEFVHGDIRNADACARACEGVQTVFHLAAIASVASSVADPLTSHDVNITGTLNLLNGARKAGVRRFVFSSSASVYGNAEVAPTREDQPLNPQSPYASGKACGEFYCRNFWELFGLETVILRYFNVFGPRQSAVSGYAAAIPAFVDAAIEGRSPTIFGDGKQTRDFVYVQNVAAANVLAAIAPGAAGEVLNVAGGTGIALLDVLTELETLVGRTIRPVFQPSRPGEVRHSLADTSRARAILGYYPQVSFEEGLAQMVPRAYEASREGAVLAAVA